MPDNPKTTDAKAHPSVKILIASHKPFRLKITDDILTPAHTWRSLFVKEYQEYKRSGQSRTNHNMGAITDFDYEWMIRNTIACDSGDNTLNDGKRIGGIACEFWAYNNYEKLDNPDYIGSIMHRRYFVFNRDDYKELILHFDRLSDDFLDRIGYSPFVVRNVMAKYDLILPNLSFWGKNRTNYQQYKESHCSTKELDFCIAAVKQDYPEMRECVDRYFFNEHMGYVLDMYIMKKDLFFEYFEFLYNIYSKLKAANFDSTDYSIYDDRAYAIERMYGVYMYYLVNYKKVSYKTLPVALVARTDIIHNPKPKHGANEIPIIFCADGNAVDIASAAIASIMSHSSTVRHYSIFILSSGVSEADEKRLKLMFEDKPNFSLRLIDMRDYIGENNTFMPDANGEYESDASYYKLWLPAIFDEFEKALCFDCEIAALRDVAELYDLDMGDNLIGAAGDTDLFVQSYYFHKNSAVTKEYISETLKLPSPYDCVQSGVMLCNIKAMKSFDFIDKCFAWLKDHQNTMRGDQDAINAVCSGRIFRLQTKWNVQWHIAFAIQPHFALPLPSTRVTGYLPQRYCDDYIDARDNPYVVHFSSAHKPWNEPRQPLAEVFWRFARQTPFYEQIVYRLQEEQDRIKYSLRRLLKNKRRVYRTLNAITFGLSKSIRRSIVAVETEIDLLKQ
ncbi:MAG: glycosyltransferase family 8 protein [Helicobacteraceae bacterium]|jgi:lipopolysaccharide biosynthesis glycosyltransferase|nr:glycosyltransferase family 8 protein [Helicobacteraceae bacterium]